MADQVPLTDRQQQVYEAAAAVEQGGRAGTSTEIAEQAGMPAEVVRAELAELTGDRLDLLRELPAPDGITGPRYSVKGEPSPEAGTAAG